MWEVVDTMKSGDMVTTVSVKENLAGYQEGIKSDELTAFMIPWLQTITQIVDLIRRNE